MKSRLSLCAVLSLAALVSARPASAETIYALAQQGAAQSLVSFDTANPTNLLTSNFVSGLQTNETLLGIDFRPATGQLYALGSSRRLYTVSTGSGAASVVGGQFATALNGVNFGFDFNPQIDRIRVVSESNQNLVLDPNLGTVQLVATNLAYVAGDPNFGKDPNVVDSAYDNNVNGAQATQLYGIDTGLDILVKQANNAGTLTTVVGGLGIDVVATGGFDISGDTGLAYAVLQPANASQASLYRIALGSGAAANLGVVDGGLVITAMSVQPAVPEPATAGLLLSGMLAMVAVRRRAL